VGRILAIDVGQKRIGLAVSDPLRIIAGGLETQQPHTVFDFLQKYVNKEKVDEIVVGYPKQMNNQDSESMRFVKPFVEKLNKLFPDIPVILIDERFTSKMASMAMVQGGVPKMARRDKAKIDEISAVIILQDYLEMKKND
jgi:putative Holliday junction resolvase